MTEGVVRVPSAFSMTLTWSPSITATAELVVPRSIPMIFAMLFPLSLKPPAVAAAAISRWSLYARHPRGFQRFRCRITLK